MEVILDHYFQNILGVERVVIDQASPLQVKDAMKMLCASHPAFKSYIKVDRKMDEQCWTGAILISSKGRLLRLNDRVEVDEKVKLMLPSNGG